MTPRRRVARTRAGVALACAAITVLAFGFMGVLLTPPSHAQVCIPSPCETTTSLDTTTTTIEATTTTSTPQDPAWDGSRFTGPTANGETVSDGTFTGVFSHTPGTPAIAKVDFTATYPSGAKHGASCPEPGQQPTFNAPSTSTSTPQQSSTVDFLFEVEFACNGVYNAKATATLDQGADTKDLTLTSLRVAVPPQPPLSLTAADNGNRTATLTWQPPNHPPPDFVGFRVSRRDEGAQQFSSLADLTADSNSYLDAAIPNGGGSYFYKVESLRNSPSGLLTSAPVITSDALHVSGADNPTPGRPVSGAPTPASSGGSGAQHFDDTTLAGEDGEPGGDALPVPGAGAIQRFAGSDGAGLLKPFAAALDLGVWAALLLFLTRRASQAEKVALLSATAVEFEHPA